MSEPKVIPEKLRAQMKALGIKSWQARVAKANQERARKPVSTKPRVRP